MDLHVKKHCLAALCFAKRMSAFCKVLKTKELLMRVSIVAILLSLSGLLMAGKGNGQDLDKIIVSVNFKNSSLKNALHKIERLAQVSFTYKTHDVIRYDNVNYKAVQISVAKLLDDLLKTTDLGYELVNSNILIKKIKEDEENKSDEVPAKPQLVDGIIKGKVTDQKGSPLPNASIQLLETNYGTIANNNGEFVLTGIRPGAYKLQITAIGFEEQVTDVTVRENEETGINFQLKEKDNNLEEIVVTALGIRKEKRSIGYSTQQISGDNLTLTKQQNIIGSLGGRIAGVQVSGSSGASMGGTQKIQIRGVNSVTGGGQPLVVVDGTPISDDNFADKNGPDFGNLSQDINPDDIESVNVLKGPAASALYGLRGQYGVIMITTKKGNKNAKRPIVNLSSAYSIEKAGNFMELQNIYGAGSSLNFAKIDINGVETPYVDGSWDESWGPKMDGTPVRQTHSFYPADPDFGKATPFIPHPDNVKDWFETGHTFNNNISFAGGGANTAFRLSYNNTDIKGIEPNSYLKRNNLSFNGSLDIASGLVLTTSLNYGNNKGQRPAQGYYNGSRNFYQWFERNLDMKKLKQYKYPDGTFFHWNLNDPNSEGIQEDMKPIDWNNPYFEAYENPSHDSRDRFYGNVGLTYTILPGLQVSGYVKQDGYTQNIDTRNADGGRFTPDFSIGKYESKEMNYEIMAQYTKNFGSVSLNANAGGNILTQRFSYLKQTTVGGFTTPGWFNIANSIERPDAVNYLRKKEIRSAYASATLGYENTYFIDASLRRDISSTLPPDNNAYLYPSVSASVIFSEIVKWQPLSYGKLRLSYAQAGSDLSPYKTTNTYALGDPYGTNFPLYVPDALKNPDLKPSVGTAYEAGLEMQFLNNRIGFNATYYHQENKRQIINLSVPGVSGFQSFEINAGNIQNKGVELTVNGVPVKTQTLNWTSTLNYSKNNSKIKELYPGFNSLLLDQNRYSSQDMYLYANVGEAFGTVVGNAYKRDPKSGKILLDAANLPLHVQKHNFGSVLPKFTGGWQNTITWKNIDLSALIDFQSGGQFFSWTRMLAVKSGQAAETAGINDKGHNVRDPLADGGGVKVTGISEATGQEVTAYVSARSYYRNVLGTRIYEEWLMDASYVKMRELRLGYTFKKSNFAKMPFASVNVAFIARNPFMIYQKAPKGINPDELSTGASSLNWLETGQLATTRSFGVNLNISF